MEAANSAGSGMDVPNSFPALASSNPILYMASTSNFGTLRPRPCSPGRSGGKDAPSPVAVGTDAAAAGGAFGALVGVGVITTFALTSITITNPASACFSVILLNPVACTTASFHRFGKFRAIVRESRPAKMSCRHTDNINPAIDVTMIVLENPNIQTDSHQRTATAAPACSGLTPLGRRAWTDVYALLISSLTRGSAAIALSCCTAARAWAFALSIAVALIRFSGLSDSTGPTDWPAPPAARAAAAFPAAVDAEDWPGRSDTLYRPRSRL
mmetsp:Transcript_2514/g.4450  ORF Transcript_2514/g.4450 Transcript_2514/m.4450 type:complete len:270 (+) Transcript_2514:569-1378(+)